MMKNYNFKIFFFLFIILFLINTIFVLLFSYNKYNFGKISKEMYDFQIDKLNYNKEYDFIIIGDSALDFLFEPNIKDLNYEKISIPGYYSPEGLSIIIDHINKYKMTNKIYIAISPLTLIRDGIPFSFLSYKIDSNIIDMFKIYELKEIFINFFNLKMLISSLKDFISNKNLSYKKYKNQEYEINKLNLPVIDNKILNFNKAKTLKLMHDKCEKNSILCKFFFTPIHKDYCDLNKNIVNQIKKLKILIYEDFLCVGDNQLYDTISHIKISENDNIQKFYLKFLNDK